jgi:hypothetical protein
VFAEDQFSQELLQLYMQTPFVVPEIQFDGSEIFVTDFDGIYEKGKHLHMRTYEHFCDPDINPDIEITQLKYFISLIDQGEKPEEVCAKMRDYLRSKNFVRWQNIEGCKRAANDWEPNEKSWYNLNQIKKHHPVIVYSGSVQEALEMVAPKVNFEKHEMIGTIFEFEEGDYGKLKEIYPMLGEEKLKRKRKMIGDAEHIVVTDDMRIDYMIMVGALFSITEDFEILFEKVKKCEYSIKRARRTSKDGLARIIDFVKVLKTTDSREEFITNLQYLRLELGEFDFIQKETVYQYENDNTENQKKLKEVILATLKQLPEFVNIEAFERLVEKYGPK